VVLVAIAWELYRRSVLYEGHGVDVPKSLSGKCALITGSTSGLGFDAARRLYEIGAHVIVQGPNATRTAAAAARLQNWAGAGEVTPLSADLSDFHDVRRLASEILNVCGTVDLLVLNAATLYMNSPAYPHSIYMVKDKPDSFFESKGGQDRVMATNYLGHFLLTALLAPRLAAKASIVVVGSPGAWQGLAARLVQKHRYPWHMKQYRFISHMAYQDSKLALVCFTRTLRRRLADRAKVVLVDPGLFEAPTGASREKPNYQQRLYLRAVHSEIWQWSAPTLVAGKMLLKAMFLTVDPVPDQVYAYWLPREWISFFASQKMEGYRRRKPWVQLYWLWIERFTYGDIHASIGPECDEQRQQALWQWSADATKSPPGW